MMPQGDHHDGPGPLQANTAAILPGYRAEHMSTVILQCVSVSERPPDRAHWTDEPLDVAASDPFGRGSFVNTVVSRIQLAQAADPSTVFGLVGAWGSGKSSILARVREGLAEDWSIADFTPWSSGDAAAMSLEFVSTLADVLGERALGQTRSQLAGYAGFATPLLAAIPLVGAGVKGAADQALSAVASRPPWHRQFEALSIAIQSLGKRVLIVVDDVDRLGGSELLTLLKVIRLLGRFRGVHYLIAYDQSTVEDLLRSTGSVGRSASFMEKIVQYPFETPPVPRAAVIRLLNEVLSELLMTTGRQLDEISLLRASELVEILAPQIRTPRTLGRFREHLIAFSAHVNAAELDLVDYVAITWLRLAAHSVWALLPSWQTELRTGEQYVSLIDTEKLSPDDWERRFSAIDTSTDVAGTLAVLALLFPGVSVRGRSYYYEHPLTVSDPTYFGRYLLLAIPEDDVSDELIRTVVLRLGNSELAERSGELCAIVDGRDEALSNLAISRISDLRRNADATSLDLLGFLAARLKARSGDIDHVGAPRNSLRAVLAREIALAIISGLCDAKAITALIGERESLKLAWLAPRSPQFRSRGSEILEGFGQYWLDRLHTAFDDLREQKMLVSAAELIVQTHPHETIAGGLDFAVSDYVSYVELAQEFVYFAEWVGGSVTYELTFRRNPFTALLSADLRAQFEEHVRSEQGSREYEVDEYPLPDAPPETLRAFTIDSLAKLYD